MALNSGTDQLDVDIYIRLQSQHKPTVESFLSPSDSFSIVIFACFLLFLELWVLTGRLKVMMGQKSYLATRAGGVTSDLISSDMKELVVAAKKLADHSVDAIKLRGLGFGTTFLEWVACFAAM